MMKIERLLAIVVLLLNLRTITANQLAERFEVSVQKVYRGRCLECISENERGLRSAFPLISHGFFIPGGRTKECHLSSSLFWPSMGRHLVVQSLSTKDSRQTANLSVQEKRNILPDARR
jgi:hypothetical protein